MPKISKFRPDDTTPEPYDAEPGDPQQAMTIVWRSPDGTAVAGLFSSAKGKFSAEQFGNESTLVRKGRVIVTADDGSSVECGPGDVMTIEQGTTCSFEVLEDLEDYFVISNPNGVDL